MGKYRYICFVKWAGFPTEEWLKKHGELAEKYGLKLSYRGAAFGVPEDSVLIYKGDTPVEKYRDFRIESYDPNVIDHSNTVISVKAP